MTDIESELANPEFDGMSISEAIDYCINQDPQRPTRFIQARARYQDDEQLVRDYALKPEVTEGLWRMKVAGKLNCTCEAIAMHFDEFDEDVRAAVIAKVQQLSS